MAATKKDDLKNENTSSSSPAISTATKTSASTTFTSRGGSDYQKSTAASQEHFQVNEAIDQTKENIRRSIDEAKREIPQYAQSVTEYHRQAMDSAEAITDNYLDSQREIINSTQQTWTNYLDTVYWWMSPRKLAEMYTRAVSNFADNSVSASRIWNETLMATMDASKAYIVRTKEASKDISRITANTARTIMTASTKMRNGSSSSGGDVESQQQQHQRYSGKYR